MPSDKPPAPIVEAETFESTPSTSDPTFKYYQVAVPNYAFNQTGDQTGVTRTVANVSGAGTAGKSFIRLGAFPDVTNPTMGPAGFVNSLALANLVGSATGISGVESKDSAPSTYKGDPNFLLGFSNDTRVQNPKAKLTPAQGEQETLVLLTKGGWWDHSDGNRISTTAGDRIDIIQGNYKMVVVGRQPDVSDPTTIAGSTFVTDVSGGLWMENNPTPSHCIKSIEWTLEPDPVEAGGTWSVYQNNGAGNVYSSFYGNTGDVFQGASKESWTGIPPPGFPLSTFYNNILTQRGTFGPATVITPDLAINDYTWATTITSYTGSDVGTPSPITTITEYTFAETITTTTGSAICPILSIVESTYANATTSTTTVTGAVTETSTIGSSSGTMTVSGSTTETTTVGGSTTETTTVGGSTTSATTVGGAVTETTTVGSTITSVTTAPVITEVTASAVHTEVEVVGLKADVFVGAVHVDLYAALLKLEASIGFNVEFNLSQKFVCTLFDTVDFGPERSTISFTKFASSVTNEHVAGTHTLVGAIVQLGQAAAAAVTPEADPWASASPLASI